MRCDPPYHRPDCHGEQWCCDCCGRWVAHGAACPQGTTEAMYDDAGEAMLQRRPHLTRREREGGRGPDRGLFC